MTELNGAALIAQAEKATGLSAWGDAGFAEGLDVLTTALASDERLSALARAGAAAQLGGLLEKRLRLYDDRARHPEIAAQTIAAPLIVVGLPRSGTTILHALLAQDPRARSPLTWEIDSPSPPPRAASRASDPRIAANQAQLDRVPLAFKQMHMIGATLPQECNAIAALAFQSSNFGATYDIPAYEEWYLAADDRAPYAVHRAMLQHLQAFAPGEHWVLKSPCHMFHMARLFETYPDARVVFPHRDPAATIGSLASLIGYLREQTYGAVDRRKIGPEMARYWGEALERTMAFRDDPAFADRFVDIDYTQLIADPLRAVAAVYRHFGIELTAEAEQAMRTFLDRQPQDKHGAHRYTLEDHGLSKAAIHDAFAAYLDRFPVARV